MSGFCPRQEQRIEAPQEQSRKWRSNPGLHRITEEIGRTWNAMFPHNEGSFPGARGNSTFPKDKEPTRILPDGETKKPSTRHSSLRLQRIIQEIDREWQLILLCSDDIPFKKGTRSRVPQPGASTSSDTTKASPHKMTPVFVPNADAPAFVPSLLTQ